MERKTVTLEQIGIAYCLYYATGEGCSIYIAVGSSRRHAECHFRQHVPEYFHRGMLVRDWLETTEELEMIKTFVPEQVIDLITDHPPGTTEHFSLTHWNLS